MRAVSHGSHGLNRRRFVLSTSALAAISLVGLSRTVAAEPQPETKRVRIVTAPATCFAPLYLAEQLLHLEGFSEVEYVKAGGEPGPSVLANNRADFAQWDVAAAIPILDAAKPILILAGLHPGCQELMGNDRVRAIRDLKGKRIAVGAIGNADHINISSMLAYVGIDPRKDVTWIAGSEIMDAMKLFMTGEADAFFAFAPQPQEVRKQNIGHTIVDTLQDRPWSQYFCCTLIGNRDFVRTNPIATKRVTRAILKAADICASEPERASRYVVDKGYEERYDTTLEIVKSLPYRRWRDIHPEDTLRFHALRLYEVGMIKTNPNKLIAQGTDWRFLNQLKKELKA